jgi:hypothetical protein
MIIFLEWCSSFVGSESGQKQSVCRIWSTTQLNTPPPTLSPPFGGKGEGGEVIEKLDGQQYTRGIENTNMTGCIFSP